VVTTDELDELLGDCPTLFHMAEAGSWSNIRQYGLLSTSSLMDLLGVSGDARERIVSMRRPESVVFQSPQYGRVVVRDNKPMDDAGLRRALDGSITPTEWYELLNSRVFFWLTHERLIRLLNAGSYVDQEHDVLELDAASIVSDYRGVIELCPINSGATKPMPAPRGRATFQKIDRYPYDTWRKKRRKGERVVELTIPGGVSNIEKYTKRVVRMKAAQVLSTLFSR
jgi:hypothetical protein